jgi:dynein heavy chain
MSEILILRAQQHQNPARSLGPNGKPSFPANPTGENLLSNVDKDYNLDAETTASLTANASKPDPDILVQMFYDYFDTAIKSHVDSRISHEWIDNITSSIPHGLAGGHPEILHALLEEVKVEYNESGKQSAVKHILKRPPMNRTNDLESCNDEYLFEKDKCPFPSGWRKGYLETREKISRTLYLTHPLMLKILKLWSQYDSLRLVDTADIRHHESTAFRMTGFRSMLLLFSEKCRDQILNGYSLSF